MGLWDQGLRGSRYRQRSTTTAPNIAFDQPVKAPPEGSLTATRRQLAVGPIGSGSWSRCLVWLCSENFLDVR